MPKSSTAMRTPRPRNRCSVSSDASTSSISTLSVISSSRRAGGMPVASRMARTSSTSEGWPSWRPDRLTDTCSGRCPGSAASHRRAWTQACSITHRPMPTISPVSSATPMNSLGWRSPRSGCSQRSSASTPLMAPVTRSTTGW
ncbi:MAG: hypothetical protein R2699_01145 [Acidimicrobiales bacterium]